MEEGTGRWPLATPPDDIPRALLPFPSSSPFYYSPAPPRTFSPRSGAPLLTSATLRKTALTIPSLLATPQPASTTATLRRHRPQTAISGTIPAIFHKKCSFFSSISAGSLARQAFDDRPNEEIEQNNLGTDEAFTLPDEGNPDWGRYPIGQIQHIVVRRRDRVPDNS